MKILILGGAGFIGINAARYFLSKGNEIIVIDNLSRKGSEYNVQQLQKEYSFKFINEDIRNFSGLKNSFEQVGQFDVLLLLAGQVAVTTSVTNPREDFEINALGTFNVLEALRVLDYKPFVIYSSTNKVYGKMEDIDVKLKGSRYEYSDKPHGIGEDQQLDFHSPYGCSKGAGEQYVRDYSRIYSIPTVVFRQSCIYGENQFGIEDQGWVAWFTIANMLNKRITVYGDGNQIRDVLYIQDLLKAYEAAINNKEIASGKIYNVGGGPFHTLSLNELIKQLEDFFSCKISPLKDDWRPGDQKVYVSDIRKIKEELGWQPETNVEEGIKLMSRWILENKPILEFYTLGIAESIK